MLYSFWRVDIKKRLEPARTKKSSHAASASKNLSLVSFALTMRGKYCVRENRCNQGTIGPPSRKEFNLGCVNFLLLSIPSHSLFQRAKKCQRRIAKQDDRLSSSSDSGALRIFPLLKKTSWHCTEGYGAAVVLGIKLLNSIELFCWSLLNFF